MKQYITERTAFIGTTLILTLFVLLHFCILIGLIPFQMVWGGRLENSAQMRSFETISLLFNLIMLGVILIRAGLIKLPVHPRLIRVAIWIMFGLFVLNTIGNLLSRNLLEKAAFTPLTILLSLFCFKLASKKSEVKAVKA